MRATLFILKCQKPLELISFLFGDENTVINNLLDVKKLSVFVRCVTTEFYIFGKQTLGLYIEERLK